MRTRTPVIVHSTVAAGATAFRRTLSLMAALALAGTLMLGGCGPAMTRPQVSEQDLLKLRTKGDEQAIAEGRRVLGRSLERAKAEYDRYTAGGRKEPPVIDILIISGGGDWGAFGAGVPQGVAEGPGAASTGQARVQRRDRSEHRHLDRAIRFPGRSTVDRRHRGSLSQPAGGLGEAARVSIFLAGQHFFRRGTRTGARNS